MCAVTSYGRFGGPPGVLPQVGVTLPLEQSLRERGIRLLHPDDVRTGGELPAVGPERSASPFHFNHGEVHRLQQTPRCAGIRLLGRDHKRIRRGACGGAALDVIKSPEEHLAPHGGGIQKALHGDELIRHDVAQRPSAAEPRFQVIPGAFSRRVTGALSGDFGRIDVHRGGDPDAGRFAQDAQSAVVALVMASRGPVVVDGVDDDALAAGCRQIGGHVHAHHVAELGDQGIDVGLYRIQPRRDEHSGAEHAHLVDVIDNLRPENIMQFFDDGPVFRLGEEIPVAVIVMADVFLIELGRTGALERGAQGAAIPGGHEVEAIGVDRRGENENHVVEHAQGARILSRGEAVGQLDGRMRGRHLGGVDAARDQNDGLPFPGQAGGFVRRRDAGVGEAALDVQISFQVPQGFRSGNHGRDHGTAFCGFAVFQKFDAR
ncbi:MAG: hypothetical protein KatS3mg005_1010 [Bryobacteraceae bacterium]|nr:MAG: hypothetical protein KatS3mg005_1010 [Bryobacteraceae bacterium]